MTCAIILLAGCDPSRMGEAEIRPARQWLAWQYPGDEGIENDLNVVFAENFETGDLADLEARWGYASNRGGRVMSYSDDVPAGSAGKRSLQMTATRGENSGGELYKAFEEGWDKIHLRFYTRFAEDHGNYHHFVALRGFKDPLPYPVGGAGQQPENHFSVTIDPNINHAKASENHSPPGIWHFYAYWPEMRSWQSPEGEPDGRPNPYYGNSLQPGVPAVVPRGEWIAVEVMLKLNSSTEKSDGEVALWIDGEPVVHYAPGTPRGYWASNRFLNDPGLPDAQPFEGFRWRHDRSVSINVLRLQHYVSGSAFDKSQAYAEANPDYLINTRQAAVWFDHVVMAKEYIGPMRRKDIK